MLLSRAAVLVLALVVQGNDSHLQWRPRTPTTAVSTLPLCRFALRHVTISELIATLSTSSPKAQPVIADRTAGVQAWAKRDQFMARFGHLRVQPIQSNTVFSGPSKTGHDTTVRNYLQAMRRPDSSVNQLFASSHYHSQVHKVTCSP